MLSLKYSGSSAVLLAYMCRMNEGIPQFRIKSYKPDVLFVCEGGEKHIPSVLLTSVNNNDISLMENNTGDWKYIVMKYKPEVLGELEAKPEILNPGIKIGH